ncbi:unnamed protein product [Caenorhabditis angaria]|uniref:SANT domain-containing protein n=1 Tax=Caenorhabditis angaria TaxID=860376 RepID=A0A9P1N342_9PELO|nr:unnamed protein product [Caenorhabditis angaria]
MTGSAKYHYYFQAEKPKDCSAKEAEKRQAEEQKLIDSAKPLTEKEEEEKQELLKQGATDWTKREFQLFLRANEKYGREDLENIAKEMEKPLEEVKDYCDIFWTRFEELQDAEKILSNIEKGELRIQRRQAVKRALDAKVAKYKSPFQQLRIAYGANKGKTYTEDEDRFLVCEIHRLGFDKESVYEEVRQSVRNAPQFRFDWFLKSRTAVELQRRANTLITLIEREMGEVIEPVDKKRAAPAAEQKPIKGASAPAAKKTKSK